MAAIASASVAVPIVAVSANLEKSTFAGASLPCLPVLKSRRSQGSVQVVASGAKKISVKNPWGPSGDTKIKVDASGQKMKGKGTFQFTKKYGANVDGYSPIWAPEDWSAKGDTYEGGVPGLALWAVTFGGLLAAGAILVYSTSSLS